MTRVQKYPETVRASICYCQYYFVFQSHLYGLESDLKIYHVYTFMNMHFTYVKLLAMSEYSASVNLLNIGVSKSIHYSNSMLFILTPFSKYNFSMQNTHCFFFLRYLFF